MTDLSFQSSSSLSKQKQQIIKNIVTISPQIEPDSHAEIVSRSMMSSIASQQKLRTHLGKTLYGY